MKNCSPPSVGSMILKAAQKQNHETFAFGLLQLRQYAPFLHHLLHIEFCKIHGTNCIFCLWPPFGKLYLASSALSDASKVAFPHFRIASAITYCPFWEAIFSIVCFIACILNDISTFSHCFCHHLWPFLGSYI